MSSKEATEFLSEKSSSSSPFKRLKLCLAAHRIDKPVPARAPGKPVVNKGFLATHRTAAYECLIASLEAYEQHRDETVEKLKGTTMQASSLAGSGTFILFPVGCLRGSFRQGRDDGGIPKGQGAAQD